MNARQRRAARRTRRLAFVYRSTPVFYRPPCGFSVGRLWQRPCSTAADARTFLDRMMPQVPVDFPEEQP
jgi:hypothetical protein